MKNILSLIPLVLSGFCIGFSARGLVDRHWSTHPPENLAGVITGAWASRFEGDAPLSFRVEGVDTRGGWFTTNIPVTFDQYRQFGELRHWTKKGGFEP